MSNKINQSTKGFCGEVLHPDNEHDSHTRVPSGWKLCYIDHGDTTYKNRNCQDMIRNVSSPSGITYSSSTSLLNAGGNFGCWRGVRGSSTRFQGACKKDYQHSNGGINSSQVFYVCIKFP